MHAAVPQSFRPVFLHLIKLNYLPEAAGDPSVEGDVLVAPFCQALGAGYYDFDPRVRLLLLDNLQAEYSANGAARLRSVATFLLMYLQEQERFIDSTQDRLSQSYIELQRWVALSILDPDGAAHQLAGALSRIRPAEELAARVRIGGLVNAMAGSLLRYPRLADYALGVQALECGEMDRARELLSALGDTELQIGPVTLRSARTVLEEWSIAAKASKPRMAKDKQGPYASCLIVGEKGEETNRFVRDLIRELRRAGVDCQSEEEALPFPLAGRRVLLLVGGAREEVNDVMVRCADEAMVERIPIITLSLGRFWLTKFEKSFDPAGNVNFSDRRSPDSPAYRAAVQEVLRFLEHPPDGSPQKDVADRAARRQKKVFLAYAPQSEPDRILSGKLSESLSSAGYRIFDATHDLTTGSDWASDIQRAVSSSEAMIVLLSTWSSRREWIRREIKMAVEAKIKIIPVTIGRPAKDLPVGLSRFSSIAWNQESDTATLISRIREVLGRTKLYVGGLPYSTTEDELEDAFGQAGTVISATVLLDKLTNRSRGFGFVEMATEEEAEKAIDMWNGKDFGGRKLTVNEVLPLGPRVPRGDDRYSGPFTSEASDGGPGTQIRGYISYAREEDELANAIVRHLEQRDIRTFKSRARVTLGASERAALEKKAVDANVFIVLLSEASLVSTSFLADVALALHRPDQPLVIPVRIGDQLELPEELMGLNRIQWALWNSEADTDRLLYELDRALESNLPFPGAGSAHS
jgi:cold-inducible RNA-binding protein